MIPHPWQAIILVLAAFRLTRITGWDDFPPVEWVRDKITGKQQVVRGDFNERNGLTPPSSVEVTVAYKRPVLAHGLFCAYCAGFWWCGVVYTAWRLWPFWTLTVAFVLAMSSFVGTWARILDP